MSRNREYLNVLNHIIKVSKGNPNLNNRIAIDVLVQRLIEEDIKSFLNKNSRVATDLFLLSVQNRTLESIIRENEEMKEAISDFWLMLRKTKIKTSTKTRLRNHKAFNYRK